MAISYHSYVRIKLSQPADCIAVFEGMDDPVWNVDVLTKHCDGETEITLQIDFRAAIYVRQMTTSVE